MLLGFDIGGTKCTVILGDSILDDGISVIGKCSMAIGRTIYEMIDLLFTSAEELLASHQIDLLEVEGISIICGGWKIQSI